MLVFIWLLEYLLEYLVASYYTEASCVWQVSECSKNDSNVRLVKFLDEELDLCLKNLWENKSESRPVSMFFLFLVAQRSPTSEQRREVEAHKPGLPCKPPHISVRCTFTGSWRCHWRCREWSGGGDDTERRQFYSPAAVGPSTNCCRSPSIFLTRSWHGPTSSHQCNASFQCHASTCDSAFPIGSSSSRPVRAHEQICHCRQSQSAWRQMRSGLWKDISLPEYDTQAWLGVSSHGDG